eukprot:763271-Hanusia_phi.AAC.1
METDLLTYFPAAMETDPDASPSLAESPLGKQRARQRSSSLPVIEDSTLIKLQAWQRERRDSEEGLKAAPLRKTGSFVMRKELRGRALNVADIYLYTELKALNPRSAEQFVREVLSRDLASMRIGDEARTEEVEKEQEAATAAEQAVEKEEANDEGSDSTAHSHSGSFLRRSSSEGDFSKISSQLTAGKATSANSGLIYTSEAYLVEKELVKSEPRRLFDCHSDSTRSV